MKHTQGPWAFMLSANGDTLSLVNIREMPMRNGTIEETVLSINIGTIPVDANRRLIAAAPDMLEILIELQARGLRGVDAATRARVQIAIDKARGAK